MSGVRIYTQGGPDVLRYEMETVGEPGPGQVRLRHEAIGVNYVDTYFRAGTFPLTSFPAVIGTEGAGVVEVVGPGVTEVSAGDRVGYTFELGSYAQMRLVTAASLIPLPPDVSTVDAASLIANGLTSWGRLHRVYPVGPGDVVLVTGATGGVGSVLAPWAQHLGATVVTPVASEARIDAARALGLKNVVGAGTGELASTIAALGKPVDVFYDVVGRATFAEAISVVRDGGTVDLIGGASGQPEIDAADLERRGIHLARSPANQHVPDRASLLTAAEALFQAWRDGVFGTRTVRTARLSDAAAAHVALEAGITEAAIVLLPDAD